MEKKKRSSKNLKISTRITISTIFAVAVPLIIVFAFSSVFVQSMASYFNVSTVDSNHYSMVNQIQWNQTVTFISDELVSEESLQEKQRALKRLSSPLEKLGSDIYIESDSKQAVYSTKNKEDILEKANKITTVDLSKNLRYFSQDGMIIVSHVKDEDNGSGYTVLIANERFTVSNVFEADMEKDAADRIFSRSGLIIMAIVLVFILTIVAFSLLTSSTIVKPLKKLSEGADEIARGNLEYVIDYDSTNEIGVTVDSFNKMTDRLRESLHWQHEAENSKREMIEGVAHDLRTPMTSVKGYAEGLMDGIADTPEKQSRYLQRIYASTVTMEKLLNELLTVSKLEDGRLDLDLQEIRFNDFLDDCNNNIALYLEKRGFKVEYDNKCSDEAYVMLDSDRFQRVIRNIVSNSVRYSKSDVQGVIRFTAREYQKTIILAVEDNGIGISSENLPKIFDSFYRADPARSRVSEGSGLGLYICKQIVELHNGRIWASSKEGEGLTIHIALNKIIK